MSLAAKTTATLCLLFIVCVAVSQPIIQSFSPTSGPVGTSVTITGANFSNVAANNTVFFGAVKATVISASGTSLNVTVPAGATYQPITVTTSGLTAYSGLAFNTTFGNGLAVLAEGSFSKKMTFQAGNGPSMITLADFDGDGKIDMATSNDSANSLSVFRNTTVSEISFIKKDFAAGNGPFNIASGDIDGDGKIDIALVNSISNTLSVYKNNSTVGNISFAAKLDFTTGTFPGSLAITDFDGDGKPDIAVANQKSNSISVFKNTTQVGSISFAAKSDIALVASPIWLAAGDLDGDLKPEIVVANLGDGVGNKISVFRNISASPNAISFAPKQDFVAGIYQLAVSIGDLDNDGKADLAVTNMGNSGLTTVLKNNSSAANLAFEIVNYYTTEGEPFCVAINDLDGDTKPDLVVANSNSNTVSVIKNKSGAIATADTRKYKVGGFPWGVAVGDLDGDGKPDVVTADHWSRSVSVLRNQLSSVVIQSFSPPSIGEGGEVNIQGSGFKDITGVSFGGVAATSFSAWSEYGITAVVGKGASGAISVTAGTEKGFLDGFTFLPVPTIHSFQPVVGFKGATITIKGKYFVDIDSVYFGDGAAKTAAVSFVVESDSVITAIVGVGASGSVSLFRKKDGNQAALAGFIYKPAPVITSFTPANAAPGTLVTINGSNFSEATEVLFGEAAASSFTVVAPNIITAVVAGNSGGNIAVRSPYGVGYKDGFYNGISIASFSPAAGPVGTVVTIKGVNFGNSTANNIVHFGAAKAKVISSSENTLLVVAPSGSTYAPIGITNNQLTANSTKPFNFTFPDTPKLFNGHTFDTRLPFSTGNNNGGADLKMCAADFDGDGKTDVAVVNEASNVFSFMRNTGTKNHPDFYNGGPQIPVPQPALYATGIFAADMNGDGKHDLVSVDAANNKLMILVNNSTVGTIVFNTPALIPLDFIPVSAAMISDFDLDGKFDILSVDGGTDRLIVYRNTYKNGIFSFEPTMYLPVMDEIMNIGISDLDNDGKSDIVLMGWYKMEIYKNESQPGKAAFVKKNEYDLSGERYIYFGDFNGDDKNELVLTNPYNGMIKVLANKSAANTVEFDTPIEIAGGVNPYLIAINDIDGDGKPDIAAVDFNPGRVAIFKNNSEGQTIAFGEKVADFVMTSTPSELVVCDIDSDGKPDILVVSENFDQLSVYRNLVGETKSIFLCPPYGSGSIAEKIFVNQYQWQVSTDSGKTFTDIVESDFYITPTGNVLGFNNVPSSFYGYQYRCVMDGENGLPTVLKFGNKWKGGSDNLWNNPANWSCGTLPDANTDVVVEVGSTIIVSANAICRSLTVMEGSEVKVNLGFTLTITK